MEFDYLVVDPFVAIVAGLLVFISFNYREPGSKWRHRLVVLAVGLLILSAIAEHYDHQNRLVEEARLQKIEDELKAKEAHRQEIEAARKIAEDKRAAEEARLAALKLEHQRAAEEAERKRNAELDRLEAEARRAELEARRREQEQQLYANLNNSYKTHYMPVGARKSREVQIQGECVYVYANHNQANRHLKLTPRPRARQFLLTSHANIRLEVAFLVYNRSTGDCVNSLQTLQRAGHVTNVSVTNSDYSRVHAIHGGSPRFNTSQGTGGNRNPTGEDLVKGIFGAILNNALNNNK